MRHEIADLPLDGVAKLARLLLRSRIRDDDVAQVGGYAWRQDEAHAGWIVERKRQHVGVRVLTAVLDVQGANRLVVDYMQADHVLSGRKLARDDRADQALETLAHRRQIERIGGHEIDGDRALRRRLRHPYLLACVAARARVGSRCCSAGRGCAGGRYPSATSRTSV